MTTAQPSATATIMAFHRALEMLYPESERVCQDPLAVTFLPPDWAAVLADRERLTALMSEKAKQFPGVNGAVVSRVRFIDEVVIQALADGLEQLVIVGAGFDTRAYRLEGIDRQVKVFEIDDPVTQQDKRARLNACFGATPDHVRYIAMDLSSASLAMQLKQNGYDDSKQSLFILEGLVPYIPLAAFTDLLNCIACIADSRNAVVFDYLPPSVVDGSCACLEGKNMYREVVAHGERFRLGFEAADLETFLQKRGFEIIEHVNAPELKLRYFSGDAANRPITPVFWFVHAQMAPVQGSTP